MTQSIDIIEENNQATTTSLPPRNSIHFDEEARGRDLTGQHPLSGKAVKTIYEGEDADQALDLSSASAIQPSGQSSSPPVSGSQGRRSSLAAFADRFRSRSGSREHSRSNSTSGDLDLKNGVESLPMSRSSTANSRRSMDETPSKGRKNSLGRSSSNGSGWSFTNSNRRRSSEIKGEYGDIIRAQEAFMEKLRLEQEKNNVTVNVDGLPILPRQQRRRSSVAQILGVDKQLLAR